MRTDGKKAYIPLIGETSSGKSTLIRSLMADSSSLLWNDITAVKGVPIEISYDPNEETKIVYQDGTSCTASRERVRALDEGKETVSHVSIHMDDAFLKQIPDVVLVDLPGLEPELEVHNYDAEKYLSDSLAWIITVPADNMVFRSSIKKFLEEAHLSDMPVCIAITKADKQSGDFDSNMEALKKEIATGLDYGAEIQYCITRACKGEVEQRQAFLRKLQRKA